MLVEEVKPFIEKTYRTLPGPENTGMGGSSLGGLVTLHLGIQYPQVFGKLLGGLLIVLAQVRIRSQDEATEPGPQLVQVAPNDLRLQEDFLGMD